MVSLKVGCVERFFQMFFQNFSLFPYISMFIAQFVAYLLSLLELSRQGRTAHDHQGRQSASSSFSSFLFLTGKGYGSLTPDENLANFSSIPISIIFTWNYFASIGKTLSLKCFQIAPANIKSTTFKQAVFTYSHLRRAKPKYSHLGFFSSFIFNHANYTR